MTAKQEFDGLLTKVKLENDPPKRNALVQQAVGAVALFETAFEREQAMEDLAKYSDVSKGTLKTSLRELRNKQDSLGGRPVEPKDVERWPEPVDGAELLDCLEEFLKAVQLEAPAEVLPPDDPAGYCTFRFPYSEEVQRLIGDWGREGAVSAIRYYRALSSLKRRVGEARRSAEKRGL